MYYIYRNKKIRRKEIKIMFKPNMFNTTMNNGVDSGTFHADDMFNFPCDKVTSNGIEGHAKPNMRNGTILLC